MSDELKIQIVSTLNIGKSIGEINSAISGIEKKINKIKLNLEINESSLKAITDFSNNVKKIQANLNGNAHQHGQQVSDEIKQITRTSAKYTAQTIADAKKQLRNAFGDDSIITTQSFKTGKGALSSFIVDVKDAEGQIKRVNYQIREFIKKNKEGEIISKEKGFVSTWIQEMNMAEAELKKLTQLQENLRTKLKENLIKGKIDQGQHDTLLGNINKAGNVDELKTLQNTNKVLMARKQATDSLSSSQDSLRVSLTNLYNQGNVNEKFLKNFNKVIDSSSNIKEINKVEQALQRVQQTSDNKTLQTKLISDSKVLLNSSPKGLDKQNLSSLISDLKNVNTSSSSATNSLKQMESQFKSIKNASKEATASGLSLSDAFKQAALKFPLWMGVSTMFFAVTASVKSLVDTLYVLDERMVSINKVLDNANMAEVFNNASDAALKYGQTIDGALQSLGEISKLGFNQADAEKLNQNAMLLSTVGEFKDNADAANYLVAIMRQYQLSVEQTTSVVSALNEVSNKTGADTIGLAQALSKSSSMAATAGVSFNELNGMVSNTIETLKIGGNEAGNFYKTLFARYLRGSTQSDIESVGVQTKDLAGNLRSATDVMKDLGDKYSTFSQQQKSMISESLGGVYHINKVTSLLENQAKVYQNTQYAANSYGSAEKELSTFQDGLEFKTNNMIATFQKLTMTIGENGARQAIVAFLESVTFMTKGFTDLTESTHGLNIYLPLIAAGAYGAVKAFTALRMASLGVQASFGWVGLGVVALELLASAFVSSASAANLSTDALSEVAKKTSDQTTELEKLIAKYNELQPQAQGNAEKQNELQSVLEKIQQIAPQLIESTGKYGDALDLNKEKAVQYVASLKEMTKEQVAQAQTANSIELSAVSVNIDEAKSKLKDLESSTKEAFANIQSYQDKYNVKGIIDAEKEFRDRIQSISNEIGKQTSKGNNAVAEGLTSQLNKARTEYEAYIGMMKDSGGGLQKYADTVGKLQELEGKKDGIEQRQQALNSLTGATDKSSSANDKNSDSLSNVNSQTQNSLTAYSSAEDGISAYSDAIDGNSDSVQGLIASQEKEVKTLDDYTSSISYINGILEDYQNNNKLSADTIVELIDKYPELIGYIGNEGELIKQLKGIRDNDVSAAKQQIAAKLATNEVFYNTNLKALQQYFDQHFSFYKGDLTQFKTLAKAKAAVESELIKKLAGSWAMYYNTATQQFSTDNWAVGSASGQQAVKANQELEKFRDSFDNFTFDKINLNFDKIGTSLDDTSKKSKKAAKETNKAAKEYEQFTYVTDEFKKSLEESNKALDRSANILARYDDSSANYRKTLQEEIKLLEEKNKKINAGIKSIDKQISTGKYVTPGVVNKDEAVKDTFYNDPTKKSSNSSSKTASSKVTVQSGITASQLNKYLGGELKGLGAVFVKEAKKAGIDPAFLASIAMHESGKGTSNVLKTKNNSFGIRRLNGEYRAFKSVEESISYTADMLKRLYTSKGKDTPSEINKSYAGDKNWKNRVADFWNIFTGTITSSAKKAAVEATNTVNKNIAGWNVAVNSDYGMRKNPTGEGNKMHQGVDLAYKQGSDLSSNVSGEVVWAKSGSSPKGSGYSGYGGVVAVKDSSGNVHVYAHMSEVGVEKGQFVEAGNSLGKTGGAKGAYGSGDSTGAHLHYEVRKNGQLGNTIDPMSYVNQARGNGTIAQMSNSNPTLKLGSKNSDAVKELQKALGEVANGIFNKTTLNAVKKFQKSHGLTQDGIVGSATWGKLNTTTKSASDASKKAAEKQQNKTDAQAQKVELQNQINQNNKQIQEALVKISDSWLSQFNGDSNAVQRQIDARRSLADQQDPTSKKYRDYLGQESSTTKKLETKQKSDLKALQAWYEKYKADMNSATRKSITDTINGMKDTIKATQDKQPEIAKQITESKIGEYNATLSKLDKDISLKQAQLNSINNTSSDYKKNLEDQINLQKQIETQLQAKVKFINSELSSNKKLSNSYKNELKSSLVDVNIELQNTVNNIKDINANVIEFQFRVQDKSIKDVTDKIDFIQYKMSLLTDASTIGEKLTLFNTMSKQLDELLVKQDEAIRKTSALRAEALINGKDTTVYDERLSSLTSGRRDIVKQQADNIQSEKDARKQIADNLIDTMKRAYEKQRDFALAAIDDEMTALDKRHEKVMQQYDDELSKIDEVYNKQIGNIDKQESVNTYNKDLKGLQDQRAGVQGNIDKISLDNSIEANAKRADLKLQRDDIDKQIEEMKHNREVELRKESLQNELDKNKKEVEDKKNSEQDKYDATKQRLEDEKHELQYHYDEILNNEKYWNETRTQIINGETDKVKGKLDEFLTDFQSKNESVVKDLNSSWQELQNLLDSIKASQAEITSYDSANSDSKSGSNSSPTSEPAPKNGKLTTGTFTTKQSAVNLQEYLMKTYPTWFSSVKQDGEKYRVEAKYEDVNAAQAVLDDLKAKGKLKVGSVSSYDTGGYTGVFGNEGKLAFLHEKELVLNQSDTKNLLDTFKELKNLPKIDLGKWGEAIQSSISNLITPNLPQFQPSLAGVTGGNIDQSIHINIDTVTGTRKEAESTADIIAERIKNKGGIFKKY